jgi:hypothetical protein
MDGSGLAPAETFEMPLRVSAAGAAAAAAGAAGSGAPASADNASGGADCERASDAGAPLHEESGFASDDPRLHAFAAVMKRLAFSDRGTG